MFQHKSGFLQRLILADSLGEQIDAHLNSGIVRIHDILLEFGVRTQRTLLSISSVSDTQKCEIIPRRLHPAPVNVTLMLRYVYSLANSIPLVPCILDPRFCIRKAGPVVIMLPDGRIDLCLMPFSPRIDKLKYLPI